MADGAVCEERDSAVGVVAVGGGDQGGDRVVGRLPVHGCDVAAGPGERRGRGGEGQEEVQLGAVARGEQQGGAARRAARRKTGRG